MSTLKVDRIAPLSGNEISIEDGHTLYTPGHVVQVINTLFKTPISTAVTSGTTLHNISGLSATITPTNINSKIYIRAQWTGEFANWSLATNGMWNLKRNSTAIGQPPIYTTSIGFMASNISYPSTSDSDSTNEWIYFDYYDSPNTVAAVTYQVCFMAGENGTVYTNRSVNAATSGGYERGTSSITLFEVAG
jgi:hypothetical protein